MLDEPALMEAQQAIHEMIAHHAPLEETLEAITLWVGRLLPDALVSVMRYAPERSSLSMMPNSQFSTNYVQRLQDLYIAEGTGTCGAAAFWRRLTITEDILTDTHWEAFRDAARQEGLRACWSMPILSGERLLGTFATYYRYPTAPSSASQVTLKRAASLAALAIIRERDVLSHRVLSKWHDSLFDNHPDGVYEFDLQGRFQRGNAALSRITGYAEDMLVGRHFNEFIEPGYRTLTQAGFDIAKQGGSLHYETMGTHHDGHAYRLDILNFPVSVDGEIVGVYGICRDITEQKRAAESQRLLERGIQTSPNGVLMIDVTQPDMPLVYANDSFYRLTGYRPDEVLGRNCRFLHGDDTDAEAVTAIHHAIAERRSAEVTLLNYRKDGSSFWNQLSLSPVLNEQGDCTHYIGTQQDITRQRNQEAQLAYQATHDLLTGLPNRTAFEGRLEEAFQRSQQTGDGLVVMLVDLDGFKTINDGLGYRIGHQLLVAVADRLRQVIGQHDIPARLTGDEFSLLLTSLASRQAGIDMAERILNTLSAPFQIEGKPLHISASIGIASDREPTEHAHELMQRADLAMTDAKQQGRNTWHWYQGNVQRITQESVLLRHDLYTALQHDQFELYYQPIVEAVNGRIRGLEALIRWHHPEKGMISPGTFISLAEQTGQIIPLGYWILRRACQDVAAIQTAGGPVVPVAVNISSLQFRREGFLEDVQQILAASGLPPALLELEVTESVLLDGAEQAIALINRLRAMGVRVALDDFGTGFSSLSYLRDLPIHKVKLDRAFIQDIITNRSNAAIVQGIITMAHHLGLMVVAEGIENREQQQDLIHRDCDLLQGFLFGKPLPREAAMKLPGQLSASRDA